ncbi:MAG: hypothetical protein QF718_09980 [Phycisphaerales bacterium]|jgi:hypothetical protein|nr:hypothetical protein [Phycisphaerales bacterium]
MKLMGVILFATLFAQVDRWEDSLDIYDGMSYIRAAEDLASVGITTKDDRKLVEKLYVLAGVVDPKLRESVILGLISVQDDNDFIQLLHQMRDRSVGVLVPSVVSNDVLLNETSSKQIDIICQLLSNLRNGKGISDENAELLKPWSYLFDGGLDAFIERTKNRARTISADDINLTLKVELHILGGPTLWSADYNMSSGRPVTLTENDDLVTLFHVDPTKKMRRNGQWVTE